MVLTTRVLRAIQGFTIAVGKIRVGIYNVIPDPRNGSVGVCDIGMNGRNRRIGVCREFLLETES